MAKCDYCGTTILFGGTKYHGLRFCNENCHQQGFLIEVADRIDPEIIAEHIAEVHQGDCPRCGRDGPIDVHTSHRVWSLLILTQWQSRPQVCCRRCGMKAKLGDAVFSGVAGWWGIPWGLMFTPIQIGRNLVGLISSPDPTRPSKELENMIKVGLAAQVVEASQSRKAMGESSASQ